jgi:hypothetical protein
MQSTTSTNPATLTVKLAVKLALSLATYMQEACCLKVTAATRPLTTMEARTLKTLTNLVERDTAFLSSFPALSA